MGGQPSYLERYFGKPRPEDVTYDDFERFLAQNLEEHQTLEYKSGALLVGEAGKLLNPQNRHEIIGAAALAKAIAGLANAAGGLLVLGVEEREEQVKGTVVRIRPGRVVPVPANITREIIENALRAKIQFPIEGLTIRPVRKTQRQRSFVYLIDVPASSRPPHRVNEIYYYQRYNFSTEEMKHYQIADLYGRRLGPDLDVETDMPSAANVAGAFEIVPRIRNQGNVVAKYVMVICRVLAGEYGFTPAGPPWGIRSDHRSAILRLRLDEVVYPDTPTVTGTLRLTPTGSASTDITLEFLVFAEAMAAKTAIVAFTRDTLPEWPLPEDPLGDELRALDEEQQPGEWD